MISLIFLVKDSVVIDTTGLGYRIGHSFGSWLPFLVIVLFFFLIIRKRFRLGSK